MLNWLMPSGGGALPGASASSSASSDGRFSTGGDWTVNTGGGRRSELITYAALAALALVVVLALRKR